MFKSLMTLIRTLKNDNVHSGVNTSCREIEANVGYLANAVYERSDKIRLCVNYLANSPESAFHGVDPEEITACLVVGAIEMGRAKAGGRVKSEDERQAAAETMRKIRESIKDCEYLKMKAEEHRREAEAVNLERRLAAGIYDEPGY